VFEKIFIVQNIKNKIMANLGLFLTNKMFINKNKVFNPRFPASNIPCEEIVRINTKKAAEKLIKNSLKFKLFLAKASMK
tara:strand:+ start:395 stop:631 length:237 start_codon:yes stop_codon:yes gene_type:complete